MNASYLCVYIWAYPSAFLLRLLLYYREKASLRLCNSDVGIHISTKE